VVFFQIAAALGHINSSVEEISHSKGTWFVRLGARVPEESLEVPASQKLQDYKSWVLLEANSDELDDVGMLELAHYQGFHQEVHLSLVGRQLWQCFDGNRGLGNLPILGLFEEALVHLAKGSLAQRLDKHQIISVNFHEILNGTTASSKLIVRVQLRHYQSIACSKSVACAEFVAHKAHPSTLILGVKAHTQEPNDGSQNNAADN